MSDWNFAEVWEAVAETHPEWPAQIQGRRRSSWRDFDARADGIATWLLAQGLGHQAKVAQYLYNGPEYLESVFAAWKAGMVPVNTNYRYGDDELGYLWDNADVEAVVFHGSLSERADRLRPRLGRVRCWLWVDDGSTGCPEWAVPYEQVAGAGRPHRRTAGPWGRSGDDLYLLYTGGTTGMPKGVMWRQDDLFATFNRTARVRYPDDAGLDGVHAVLAELPEPPAVLLCCPPLMHGSGSFTAFSTLSGGGAVDLLPGRRFSATEVLDAVETDRVTEMTIVGDAFAKPILAALDAEPDRWDLSSLWLIVSSGAMWAAETKAGLVRHVPRLLCVDTLGASEAVGVASSRSSAKAMSATAGFRLGPETRVLADDGRDVVPGSGQTGLVAFGGRMPLGYYKDADKTARTFRVIDGTRWSVPGDYATVEADGSVRLLGRGSVCINTGGEKVFPEEVEEILKLHAGVEDAAVVGVPDDRFGEAIVAVVQAAGAGVAEADLIAHVKGRLAHYKAPRRVLLVDSIGRGENGKLDYRRLKAEAAARLGLG